MPSANAACRTRKSKWCSWATMPPSPGARQPKKPFTTAPSSNRSPKWPISRNRSKPTPSASKIHLSKNITNVNTVRTPITDNKPSTTQTLMDLKTFEVWFVTGSQDLYGEETLKQVAAHSQTIAKALDSDKKIPVRVVYKPTVKSPEEIYQTCVEANTTRH